MTCQTVWQKWRWLRLYIIYILKENSLMLWSASEYLVSVADILMSEVSRVSLLKIWNTGRIFQEPALRWIVILSLSKSFSFTNTLEWRCEGLDKIWNKSDRIPIFQLRLMNHRDLEWMSKEYLLNHVMMLYCRRMLQEEEKTFLQWS